MIKLYNYDKETLKFKRVIELEQIPDRYEFCTLTKIPNYDVENQYLEYSKETDNWIVKEIEKPIFDLEKLKEKKIKEIEDERLRVINSKYKDQLYIVALIGGYTIKDRTAFTKYANNIFSQELDFKEQVLNIENLEDLNKFSYKFKIGE